MQQHTRRRRRRRSREGMSLIEIMVAMVIMAMVAGAAAIAARNAWITAQKHETGTRARTLQGAVTSYLLDPDRDCPSVEDLVAAHVIDATTDHEDGWGNPYTIECDEHTVHVRSAGLDETMGTEDDIGF